MLVSKLDVTEDQTPQRGAHTSYHICSRLSEVFRQALYPRILSRTTSLLLFIGGFLSPLVAEHWLSSQTLRICRLLCSRHSRSSTAQPTGAINVRNSTKVEEAGYSQASAPQTTTQSPSFHKRPVVLERDELRIYLFTFALLVQQSLLDPISAYRVMDLSSTAQNDVGSGQSDAVVTPSIVEQVAEIYTHGVYPCIL